MPPLIECVPNFSEGRDSATIDALADAVAAVAGVRLLGRESDVDHNRTVLTFAGSPEPVLEAAFRCVAVAVERIDITRHTGVHPRIGAADVLPLIPLRGITLNECAQLAYQLGDRIGRELAVPVYFYEAAARLPERRNLENIRRGNFETLIREMPADRQPDLGGPGLHPTAGAVVVGARKILLAYNINLNTSDVSIAREIARRIRTSSGGLPFVKAMGVMLHSRNLAQVSMNLTDYEQTPVHTVFTAVQAEAANLGVSIAGSELIGLWPRKALLDAAAASLKTENYVPGSLLEDRLEDNPC